MEETVISTHHRPGVCAKHRVVRHLSLAPCDQHLREAALSEIDALIGIDDVSFDDMKQRLTLAYDATRMDIDRLINILEAHQVPLHNSTWENAKRSYYEFVDDNIKDNSQRPPWSCH